MLKRWEELPDLMRTAACREYYDVLWSRRRMLLIKRIFDVVMSLFLLLLFSPLFLLLALAIRLDSKGPVFYRQTRVTQYGRLFRIHKFRSMIDGADRLGTQVTVDHDSRVTRVGRLIRACRLDELGQLLDVLAGSMTLVGTRPEVPKYVEHYTPEMYATLLLPAGITSQASILYKDEAELLHGAQDADRVYIEEVLPQKMQYNLAALRDFSCGADLRVMWKTVCAILERTDRAEER
ncbi:MAG: sugar transferase [Oscillospiraceae bacterium]|nr:sugar transferase [Oscillospiraceae bacterium]